MRANSSLAALPIWPVESSGLGRGAARRVTVGPDMLFFCNGFFVSKMAALFAMQAVQGALVSARRASLWRPVLHLATSSLAPKPDADVQHAPPSFKQRVANALTLSKKATILATIGTVGVGGIYVAWRVMDFMANLSMVSVGYNAFYLGGVASAVLAGATYNFAK